MLEPVETQLPLNHPNTAMGVSKAFPLTQGFDEAGFLERLSTQFFCCWCLGILGICRPKISIFEKEQCSVLNQNQKPSREASWLFVSFPGNAAKETLMFGFTASDITEETRIRMVSLNFQVLHPESFSPMTHVLWWGFEHQPEFLLAPYARGDLAKEISSKLNNQVFLLASELNCQSWDASQNTWEG